jgi:hypothetical protein
MFTFRSVSKQRPDLLAPPILLVATLQEHESQEERLVPYLSEAEAPGPSPNLKLRSCGLSEQVSITDSTC